MNINFFVDSTSFTLKDKRKLKSWIRNICVVENKVIGNLNFVFTSNDKILDINVQYLNHHYFTDIITFNYNEGNVISGDIYISVEKVRENSVLYNALFQTELCRVIIHGILHLIGYNDTSKKLQAIMRSKEDEALKILHEKFILVR